MTPADHIVRSRLLIMQSKMLLLTGTLRRQASDSTLNDRADGQRLEFRRARQGYMQAVLDWAPTDSSDYRRAVYGTLIELGERLLDSGARLDISDSNRMRGLVNDWRLNLEESIEPWGKTA